MNFAFLLLSLLFNGNAMMKCLSQDIATITNDFCNTKHHCRYSARVHAAAPKGQDSNRKLLILVNGMDANVSAMSPTAMLDIKKSLTVSFFGLFKYLMI